MKVQPQLMSVKYEREFKRPAFGLVQMLPAIMDNIHTIISPRYFFGTSDMEGIQGPTLADIGLRIRLFNNKGILEIKHDRFIATFDELRNGADLKIAQDCVALCEQALSKADLSGERMSRLNMSAWLKCDAPMEQIEARLKEYVPRSESLLIRDFGVMWVRPSFRADLGNNDEKWLLHIGIERSEFPDTELFLAFRATYRDGGRYNSVEERAAHVGTALLAILDRLDLSPMVVQPVEQQ